MSKVRRALHDLAAGSVVVFEKDFENIPHEAILDSIVDCFVKSLSHSVFK